MVYFFFFFYSREREIRPSDTFTFVFGDKSAFECVSPSEPDIGKVLCGQAVLLLNVIYDLITPELQSECEDNDVIKPVGRFH